MLCHGHSCIYKANRQVKPVMKGGLCRGRILAQRELWYAREKAGSQSRRTRFKVCGRFILNFDDVYMLNRGQITDEGLIKQGQSDNKRDIARRMRRIGIFYVSKLLVSKSNVRTLIFYFYFFLLTQFLLAGWLEKR